MLHRGSGWVRAAHLRGGKRLSRLQNNEVPYAQCGLVGSTCAAADVGIGRAEPHRHQRGSGSYKHAKHLRLRFERTMIAVQALALGLLMPNPEPPAGTAQGLALAVRPCERWSAGPCQPETWQWFRYRPARKEGWGAIAERFGVARIDLRNWNNGISLEGNGRKPPLLVRTEGFVPPRTFRTVRVHDRYSWEHLSAWLERPVGELKATNPRLARLDEVPKGAYIRTWLASGVRVPPPESLEAGLIASDVEGRGVAVGMPNRGHLQGGVPLPDSPDYVIRHDELRFGTALTIHGVTSAIRTFRAETGFARPIYIGALSRRRGRKVWPHKSHQTGRDVDVRLPAMPHAQKLWDLKTHEVDWPATYALLHALVRTGKVQMVFMSAAHYRHLRDAGMRLGHSDEAISAVMAVLHHERDHTRHMHIRFVCSAHASKCKDSNGP